MSGTNVIGAVDIGGTKIAVGMVDGRGQVLAKVERPSTHLGCSDGPEQITQMLRQAATNAGVGISGIGIGSTGPRDALTGEFGDVDFLKVGQEKTWSMILRAFSMCRWQLRMMRMQRRLEKPIGGGQEQEPARLHNCGSRHRLGNGALKDWTQMQFEE